MSIIRGLHTHNGALYAVRDANLLRIDSAGAATTVGTLSSTGGKLDFASLVGQLVITDGAILYVYDGATLNTVAEYTGGNRIAFIDQRLVFDKLGTQKFGWSNLNNAMIIDALDFASAESLPDNLVALTAGHGEVWLAGEYTIDIWRSVGGEDVFQSTGNTIEYGCAAPYTLRKAANTFVWLARDANGQARVLSATGYQPTRISTRAIEERFDGRDLENSTAFIYSDGPHEFYVLQVPGVDTTLVYDFAYQQWHERAEVDDDGSWMQWRATCHAFAYGKHFFGAEDGVIYQADKDTHTYGGDPLVRARIAPVISDGSRRLLTFPSFELVCEKATDASIMIRWSNDGGNVWGNWHTFSAGATGEYRRRAIKRMLGSARDRVFEIRCGDDAPFNPVSAHIEVR